MTDADYQYIMGRIGKLYHDLPIEYCGYALTVIDDIAERMAAKYDLKEGKKHGRRKVSVGRDQESDAT